MDSSCGLTDDRGCKYRWQLDGPWLEALLRDWSYSLSSPLISSLLVFAAAAPPNSLNVSPPGGGGGGVSSSHRKRRTLLAPEMNLSLDHSEGSLLSDDFLDTPDDLDINVDDIDTPDETDSLEFITNGNELEWEGQRFKIHMHAWLSTPNSIWKSLKRNWTTYGIFYSPLAPTLCSMVLIQAQIWERILVSCLFRWHTGGLSQSRSQWRFRRSGWRREYQQRTPLEISDHRRTGASYWHAGHQTLPPGHHSWRSVKGHKSIYHLEDGSGF